MAATLRIARVLIFCFTAGCASSARDEARAPLPPPIHFTVPAGKPTPTTSETAALTVATYNVHGLRKRQAVRTDLAALPDVDVWCLQEVPHADGTEIARVLPPAVWHVAVIPVNRTRAGPRWEAQVIASRFALDGVDAWPLDDAGAKRRVALAARISLHGRRVLVVNTDHEPSILALRDGNGIQTRRLATRLRGYEDADAAIVAGDFNCSGSVFRLRGNAAHVRHVDATLAAAGFAPLATRAPTFRRGPVRSRLDRIYARDLTFSRSEVASSARGSDHLPVWGRFTFPTDAADRPISDPAAAQ